MFSLVTCKISASHDNTCTFPSTTTPPQHLRTKMSSSESESEAADFLYPNANLDDDDFTDFNPRKRRRTTRNPKESAALGIFGSESEDEGMGKRWKSKTLRGKSMSFVSSGKTNQDEEDEDSEGSLAGEGPDVEDEYPQGGEGKFEAGDAYPEDEDVEMEYVSESQTAGLRGGLGSGLGRGAGLGASQSRPSLRPSIGGGGGPGRSWQRPAAASPLGMGFRPSSEDTRILEDDVDLAWVPEKRKAMPSAFSTPTNTRGGKPAKGKAGGTPVNAGSFAARMMAKMGYKEGEGLGKDGTGRSGVIEVTLRPQGVGLGAVKEKSKQEREEERRQAAMKGIVIDDSEEEERKKRKIRRAKAMGQVGGTASGNSTPKRKPKTKYQSLPEMLKAAPGLKIPDAFTPILDMTGHGQKYLTSGSGLATPTAGVSESTEVVEARKLARRAQNDLSSFVEEWKGLEERKAYVDLQMAQQLQAIETQKAATEQLRRAEEAVQGLSTGVKDGQWDPVIESLTKLEHLDVAGTDELSSIAVAAVHPFFRQAVEGWQPLEDPKLSGVASDGFASALSKIQHLLGTTSLPSQTSTALQNMSLNHTNWSSRHKTKTTPYESLIYTVWFPKVRSAITNTWDALDPSPLITLLDIWTPLLPTFVKTQILDHLLVRKLDEAIQSWNPKKSSRSSKTYTLPHLWLFPWLPYLPAHHLDSKASSGLLADVKRKFRTLIDTWDFRRGTIPGLPQWRTLLQSDRDDSWTPLMLNHALPGLARYFRTNFQVAPQDQEPFMKVLTHVFEWRDVLGDRLLGQLLVEEFFPMWMDVLHQWLTLEGVNYAEIGEWFDFWRQVFPSEINELPAVKAQWKKGSDLINTALDLGEAAKTELPAPSKPSTSTTSAKVPETSLPAAGAPPQSEEVSFRHQVEDWCMARDLQFIAEKSQLEAGGPVYRVTASVSGKGGVLIYLKNDNVFAQIKRGTWTLLGKEMDALFELAHR